MQLDARGHPLHTRALSVALLARADGRLDVRAALLDLRKRGMVPVAGDLQGTGIIHHMQLTGVIDPTSGVLDSIAAAQPAVAFEASATTGGESCRDPIGRVAALAGARLDRDFARHAGAELGGPRGCSHILTLAHLLASTAHHVLRWEGQRSDPKLAWPAGARVFRRDLVIDGQEPAEGRLTFALQLADLHFAPAPDFALPLKRLASQFELRALVETEFPDLALQAVAAAERRRGPADLAEATWQDRTAVVEGLVGQRLGAGITRTLLEHFRRAAVDGPLLDAFLMLPPVMIQCAAAGEFFPYVAATNPSLVGMGGLPDSCYMWRRDGALARARAAEGSTVPQRP